MPDVSGPQVPISLLAAPALIFFSNAFLFISMFSRLPGLTEQLDIDKTLLGLSLMGGTAGTFMVLPVASRMVERLTPRIAAASLLLCIATVQIMAFATSSYWVLLVALIIFGACRTVLEVAQNVIAMQIEADTGTRVVARSHGFWSIGLLAGSLFSGLIGGLGFAFWHHMLLAGGIVLILVGTLLHIAPRTAAAQASQQRKLFVLPNHAILLVCAMMFGVAITEGAIYDWSAFYVEQVLQVETAAVGILFSCFTIGMATTRMAGDWLRARYPAPQIVRGSVLAAATGLLLLLWSPSLYIAAMALLLIGAGTALNAPLAMNAAARLGARSPAENLAAMSLVNTFAFIGVPASLGLIADIYGLRIAFALLLLPLLASFLLAPIAVLRPRHPKLRSN